MYTIHLYTPVYTYSIYLYSVCVCGDPRGVEGVTLGVTRDRVAPEPYLLTLPHSPVLPRLLGPTHIPPPGTTPHTPQYNRNHYRSQLVGNRIVHVYLIDLIDWGADRWRD